MKKTCLKCGRTFEGNTNQKFCSILCKRLYKEELPKNLKSRKCEICGKEFYSTYKKKYCSKNCEAIGREKNTIVEKGCIECGKIFKGQKHSLTCSRKCYIKYIGSIKKKSNKKKFLKCKWCGTTFYGEGKKKFCCEEHKKNYDDLMKVKRKCKKCEYSMVIGNNDTMCIYAIKTGRIKGNTEIYPCNFYKRRKIQK